MESDPNLHTLFWNIVWGKPFLMFVFGFWGDLSHDGDDSDEI